MDATVGTVGAKISSADEPWSLPEGWCWAKMNAVALVNPSTNFDALDPTSELPFIPMAAVAEETGKIDISARRPMQSVTKGYVRFQEGDVIFAKITPCMENGKVAPVVGLPRGYAAGSTEFHVFRPAAVDQRYLWYWLVSRGFRGRAKRNMSGSAGQLRVPADWLREVDFPLAPFAEQFRIVARVDELFAEIADGEAALSEARKALDIFRRALLKAAVSGELTKDWRASNPVTETGEEFLTRIANTHSTKSALASRFRGSANAKPLDVTNLPELPKNWAWTRAQNITSLITKGTTPPRHTMTRDGQIPYLKVQNLDFDGKLHFNRTKLFVDRETHSKSLVRSKVYPGDVLINIVGPPLGQTAIVPSDFAEWNINQAIAVFRCLPGLVVEYLNLFLMSPQALTEFETRSKATSGQVNVTLEACRDLAIPIPPPAEATEILRRVSDALAVATDALAMLDAEVADAARLRQSILKAAFEGRLVPQDPDDEPASVLLKRLKAAPSTDARPRRARSSKNGRS
jgi:type I restriction enzyme S subunit